MGESVAVLSDIHGVLPALEAVLAEPAVREAGRIVLTGDIAAGPQPAEVLDLLLGLGDRVTWVRGNTERDLVALARGETDDAIPIDRWAAKQLSASHVEWLSSLPLTVVLDLAGFGQVLFCHATPRDDSEVVVVDSRLDRWAEVLAGVPDQVSTVVCGHTHMPFARLANRRQIVNPGSVGMPYGRAGAHWALLSPGGPSSDNALSGGVLSGGVLSGGVLSGGVLSGGVEMRHTPYDADVVCAEVIASSAFPEVADWTDEYLRGRISDADALAVMAPRDGRAPGS